MNTNDHMLVSFATQTLNVEDQFYKGIASIERLAFLFLSINKAKHMYKSDHLILDIEPSTGSEG